MAYVFPSLALLNYLMFLVLTTTILLWIGFKELSKLTTTSHVRRISLRIGGKLLYIFISQGFITGLPTAQMFNDSVSSTYSSFGVDSLAEHLYASTPHR